VGNENMVAPSSPDPRWSRWAKREGEKSGYTVLFLYINSQVERV